MDKQNIIILKKRIIYRCSHSGTKEADLLFNKLIVNKIEKFDYEELVDLLKLFEEVSDQDIILILKNKKKPKQKYKKLFIKLIK